LKVWNLIPQKRRLKTEDKRIATENTRQARRRSLRIYQRSEIANCSDFEKYECNKKSRRKKGQCNEFDYY
jgi:hypothetical protein